MVCLFDFTVMNLQSHWTTPGLDRAKPIVTWFLCGKMPKMSQSRAPAMDCSGPRPWGALVLHSVPRDPIPTTPPSPHSISRYRYHSVSHCVSHDPQVPEKNQKNSWKQLKTSHPAPFSFSPGDPGTEGQRKHHTGAYWLFFLGSGLEGRRLGQLEKKGDVREKCSLTHISC